MLKRGVRLSLILGLDKDASVYVNVKCVCTVYTVHTGKCCMGFYLLPIYCACFNPIIQNLFKVLCDLKFEHNTVCKTAARETSICGNMAKVCVFVSFCCSRWHHSVCREQKPCYLEFGAPQGDGTYC